MRAPATPASGQRHDQGELQVRKRPGNRRAVRKRDISHSQAAIVMISPACCTADKCHRKSRLRPGLHSDSTEGPQGPKEGAFFLVRSLQALQVLRLAGSGERGFTGAETGSEQEYGPPTAVLCCCTRLNPGLIFSNRTFDLWSYGDSNSRPLACHQQATHPPQYIAAGHRPAACTPVRPGPGRLRYFRAVLPCRSAGVHGRCGTSRRAHRGSRLPTPRTISGPMTDTATLPAAPGQMLGPAAGVAAMRWTLLFCMN